jgi:predicted nucleic acid-binding protein
LKICFDASFLSSLYAVDANTELAVTAMAQIPAVRIVTHLTELELRNSLQLRVFRKDLSAAVARSAYSDWQTDLSDGLFALHPLPEAWLRRSHLISQSATARLDVRSLDLIHVASALELDADALFSFDERQRRLARELKLKIN